MSRKPLPIEFNLLLTQAVSDLGLPNTKVTGDMSNILKHIAQQAYDLGVLQERQRVSQDPQKSVFGQHAEGGSSNFLHQSRVAALSEQPTPFVETAKANYAESMEGKICLELGCSQIGTTADADEQRIQDEAICNFYWYCDECFQKVEKKRRVLIIDDDPQIVRALASALKSMGWEVLTACDPADAAADVLQDLSACDVVLSDWHMPNGGGARVLEISNHPVVIYTSALEELPAGVPAIFKGTPPTDIHTVLLAAMKK